MSNTLETIRIEDFIDGKEVEPLWNNQRPPPYGLLKESPRHRSIIELKATGKYTNKEVAELLNFSPVTVNYVLRQPWAQKLLVELVREEGASEREAVFRLLDGVTIEAVEAQVSILRNTANEEIKRKVSNDILNRSFGTPTQKTEIVRGDDLSKLSDAEIAQRLAELKTRKQN